MPEKILPNIQKSIILGLDQGKSAEKIAKELNISSMTVSRIRNKARPDIKTSKGGCPAKLSETTKRKIARKISSGQVRTATQMAKELKNDGIASVHPETI